MSTFSFGQLYLVCSEGEVPTVSIEYSATSGMDGKGEYRVHFSSGDRLAPQFTLLLGSHQLLTFLDAIENQANKALDDYAHSKEQTA